MNTCNRSRLLFLSGQPRRRANLHILYRADCPVYCVQPTAELLHIEHKLELLHDNKSHNSIEHVRLVSLTKTRIKRERGREEGIARLRNRNRKFHFKTYQSLRRYLIIQILMLFFMKIVYNQMFHYSPNRYDYIKISKI